MAGSEPTLIPSSQSDKAEALVEELLHPDQNSAVAKIDEVASDKVASDKVASDKVASDTVAIDEVASDNMASEEENKEVPELANVLNLFHFITAFDCLIMVIGSLGAIAHGTALPLLILFFGDFTNLLINQAVTSNAIIDISIRGVYGNVSDFKISLNCNFTDSLPQFTNTSFYCLLDDQFLSEVNRLVLIYTGLGVGVIIVTYFQVSMFKMAAERLVHKIRLLFYQSILRQEIGWFDVNLSGELSSRLSDDIEVIYDGIGDKLGIFIQWSTTFVAGIVIAFVRHWELTFGLLAKKAGLVVMIKLLIKLLSRLVSRLVSRLLNKSVDSPANKTQKEYVSAGAVAKEVLSSIRTVTALGGESREIQRYNSKLKGAWKIGVKRGLSAAIKLAGMYSHIIVDTTSSFLIAAQFGILGGDVLIVFFSVVIAFFALRQANDNWEILKNTAVVTGGIYKINSRQPPIDSSSDEGLVPVKSDSTIQFNNVRFKYSTRPDVKVLDNFSLTVKVGQMVALVGPSGCGKSTVIQLLMRFYDVIAGEILVGGKDIRALNVKWLRRNLGLLSREAVLFNTTIAENIRFGKEGATMEEIVAAARCANAHDFISELPNGYNTLVGKGAIQLSAGQKQCVAIARVLVRDPKILLLDEATSSLDTESELVIQSALDRVMEGRTTIVIAHRLSTIRTANVIASIQNGQVVEAGTHEELMANKGQYFDLVTAQQSYGTDEVYIRMCSRCSEQGSKNCTRALQHYGCVPQHTSKLVSKRQLKKWDKEVPSVPLTRVLAFNLKEWWIILIGILGAVVTGGVFPCFAFTFGSVLSTFVDPPDQVQGASWQNASLFSSLVLLVGVIGGFVKTVCFSVSGEILTARLRSQSFKVMMQQEIGWYDNERNSTDVLTTRLASDAGQVQGATGIQLGTLVETFSGILIALFVAHAIYGWTTWLILWVVLILVLARILQVKAFTGYTTKHATGRKKTLENAGKIAVDCIDNIRIVAALGVEENFFEQYMCNTKKLYRHAFFHSVVYGITYSFFQGLIYLVFGAAFRFCAFLVTGSFPFQDFFTIFQAFLALAFGVLAVVLARSSAPDYAKAKLSANRIFKLLDHKPAIDWESNKGNKLESVRGEISVCKVNFSYPTTPDIKVLQELSVSVKPGQTLALVGPSGCGKSTVVSLIARFYDPQNGSLALDGSDLRDLNLHWLRSQIGIVSKEPVLFDATIAENIRYGAFFREVSDAEVIEAAKTANIHNFIESLPQGYNTNVGAAGTQLSGMQKQLVAIARVLVRDPKVLILDEATSRLDMESEKIVQETLNKAREGRTCIITAHQLSTIYSADCIAVIKEGKVVELGTHSDLLLQRGIYFKLNQLQMISNEGAEEL